MGNKRDVIDVNCCVHITQTCKTGVSTSMNPKDSTVFRISDTIYVRKKNIRKQKCNTKEIVYEHKKFCIVKQISAKKGSRNELEGIKKRTEMQK